MDDRQIGNPVWAPQAELVLVLWFRKGPGGKLPLTHWGRVRASPEGVGDFRPNHRDVLFSQTGRYCVRADRELPRAGPAAPPPSIAP